MRLLHFADTHIGVETYGRLDPETGQHSRHADFARCLERAVDLALEHEVDAALFAGDAYRTATPSPTHQQIFAGALSRLLGRQEFSARAARALHDEPDEAVRAEWSGGCA